MLLNNVTKRFRAAQNTEEGIGIVEVLVASFILILVITFTLVGFNNNNQTAIAVENNNKAMQLASDRIAIVKQAPYKALQQRTPTEDSIPAGYMNATGASCRPWDNSNASKPRVLATPSSWSSTTFKDIPTYCETVQFTYEGNPVGTTFYIETSIRWDTTSTGGYRAKKTTVIVRWKDITTTGDYDEVKLTTTKTPLASDCIPPILPGASVSTPSLCFPA